MIQAFAPHADETKNLLPLSTPIKTISVAQQRLSSINVSTPIDKKFKTSVSFLNSSLTIATGLPLSISSFNTSDARFRRSPECLKSWASRKAANNGTVVEIHQDLLTITVTKTAISTVRISPLFLVTGPTTQIVSLGTLAQTLRDDDVCCGLCYVRFPEVQVLYWPVEQTNTWCLKYNFTTATTANFPDENPQTPIYPNPDPTIPQKILPAPQLTGAYQDLPTLKDVIDPGSPFVNLNSFIVSKASPGVSQLPLSPVLTAKSQVYAVGADGFTL